MKVQTFSIVVGSRACNAHCPFCVSHMTGFGSLPQKTEINETALLKAIRLAEIGGCTTTLLTGKGEPTLYPNEISTYLSYLANSKIPLVELQTNAMLIGEKKPINAQYLRSWARQGLDTIAISTVGIDPVKNHEIYSPHKPQTPYPDLKETVAFIREAGIGVRLCVMCLKGGVDSEEKFLRVLDFCKNNGVSQLTVRNIVRTNANIDPRTEEEKFVAENALTDDEYRRTTLPIRECGTRLLNLMHGATVWDFMGQNVCLSNCLTPNTGDEIRTLIYYPTGEIAYDWQYPGAILRKV